MKPPPRLGFVGVGWIGRHRMEALAHHGEATVAAVADPCADARARAHGVVPDAALFDSMGAMLERGPALDGVVIATPSAQHATQATAALARGLAVFCQKPLGRDATEVSRVVDGAARADRLLGVDFCYRHTEALQRIHGLVQSGELGHVYGLDLTFHNAYGPDKPWFYDRAQAGGGCVMDLGIHLVDAALWLLGFPEVREVHSRLMHQGRPLSERSTQVEDYAVARIDFAGDAVAQLRCSWKLPVGRDALIAIEVFGTDGGAALRNVDGSFYDFVAERYQGTALERMVSPPDAWGGRAAVAWARQLRRGARFDARAHELVAVAHVVDAIAAQRGR
jgi:predicted dehydrogenase